MLAEESKTSIGRRKTRSDLEKMVGENIQEVRNISYNLRPLHQDLLGITQSVKSLLEDVMESGALDITIARKLNLTGKNSLLRFALGNVR